MARTYRGSGAALLNHCRTRRRNTEMQPVPELKIKTLRIAFASTFLGFLIAAAIRDAVAELAKQLYPLCAAVAAATLPL